MLHPRATYQEHVCSTPFGDIDGFTLEESELLLESRVLNAFRRH